jgi:hypothetical protein
MMETIARTGIVSTVSCGVFVTAYHELSVIDVMNIQRTAILILGILCGIVGICSFVLMVAGAILGLVVLGKIDGLGIGAFEGKSLSSSQTYLGMILTPVTSTYSSSSKLKKNKAFNTAYHQLMRKRTSTAALLLPITTARPR